MENQPQQSNNNSKRIIIFIIIILILGGGYFAYLKLTNNVNKETTNLETTVKKESSSNQNSLPEQKVALPIKLDEEFCRTIRDEAISDIYNNQEEYYIKYDVSGYCNINIGKGISNIFAFENISKDIKKPEFVLNIYTQNKEIVQSLTLNYPWEFNTSTINIHDDINADGYKDLLVRVFGARSSEFTYYIYNPVKKIFEEDDVLSNIYIPTFNKKNMEISSTADTPNYYYDKNGEQQYYTPEEQTTVFEFKNGNYVEKN